MRRLSLPPSLIVLLVISFSSLVAWSIAVPIFQAPDEPAHWRYVAYVRQNGRLPIYKDLLSNEANQPPLYYLLVAPVIADWELPRDLGADVDLSQIWAIRKLRLVTVLISLATVLCCYWIGLEATGNPTTGLLTAGLVAFLPQFTFRGMNISNDALVTLLCAAALYLVVRLVRRGFNYRVGLAAAVTIALAFLTKINSIFMPIPLVLAILSEKDSLWNRFSRLKILLVTIILIVPWLTYNQLEYGDPLASRVMLNVVDYIVDSKPITSPYFIQTFPILLFQSFVGVFGWMNIWLPLKLYAFYGLLGIVSILGYAWRMYSRRIDRRFTFIVLTVPVLSLAVTVYINLTFSQPQGRYLFPALPAIAVLIALGLEGILGKSKLVPFLTLGILALLNFYILFRVVVPAYY